MSTHITHKQAVALLRSASYTIRGTGGGQFRVKHPDLPDQRLDQTGIMALAEQVQAQLAAAARDTDEDSARAPDEDHSDAPDAALEHTEEQVDAPLTPPRLAADAIHAAIVAGDSAVVDHLVAQHATSSGLNGARNGADPTMPRRGSTDTSAPADIGPTLIAHAARLLAAAGDAPVTTFPLPDGLPAQFAAPVDLLTSCRYQPRQTFDEPALKELADSIATHGIITRLLVFANEHDRLKVIAGERRLRAARMQNLPTVPVELFAGDIAQIHELATVENLQRADLSPIEEGHAYERMLQELNLSEAELARRISKPRTYIQQRRMLIRADTQLQQALTDGTVNFTQLRAIIQAAPENHAIQRKALKRLRSAQEQQHQRVIEEDARKLTETEVL